MLLGFATLCGTWISFGVFVFGIQSPIRPPLATEVPHLWKLPICNLPLLFPKTVAVRMVPPNAREELEIIEKLNDNFNPEAPGKAGDLWCPAECVVV